MSRAGRPASPARTPTSSSPSPRTTLATSPDPAVTVVADPVAAIRELGARDGMEIRLAGAVADDVDHLVVTLHPTDRGAPFAGGAVVLRDERTRET